MGSADQRTLVAAAARRRAGAALRAAARGLPIGAFLAALAGFPADGTAVEWFVNGVVSQRLEADTNRDLDGSPSPIYGSITALGLDFIAITPASRLAFRTGVTGAVYGGPGDTDGLDRLDPNFAASYARNGKYVDVGATLGFDFQPVAFAQLDETGITSGDATQFTLRLAGDVAYALDARNRLILGGSGRVLRFTEGTTSLNPTTTLGLDLAWAHDLSPATQATFGIGGSRFTSDRLDDPTSLTFDLTTGISHAVNRRLAFGADVGLTATRTTRTIAGQEDSDFSLGALGDLQVTWQPESDTVLFFSLRHGLQPSADGELRTTTALGAGMRYAVNNWTTSALDLSLQRQTSGGGLNSGTDRTFATIAPSLAFTLTPDWALQAGYVLRLDDRSGSDAISNRVFLTLTHDFAILP